MSDDKELPVKVDVALKAELKGEIPPEKVGKAVDAVLDALSPFTQGMGLVGDHLRFHREKVIIKIGELAKEKAKKKGLEIKPVPPKFIVPFIEKASCEDIESELIEAWANLLKEASSNYSPHLLTFLNILSQLGPKEVNYLNAMVLDRKEEFLDGLGRTDIEVSEAEAYFSIDLLAYIITSEKFRFPWGAIDSKFFETRELGNDEVSNFLKNLIKDAVEKVKSDGIYMIFYYGKSIPEGSLNVAECCSTSIEILEHFSLVSYHKETVPTKIINFEVKMIRVMPTLLGAKFALTASGL